MKPIMLIPIIFAAIIFIFGIVMFITITRKVLKRHKDASNSGLFGNVINNINQKIKADTDAHTPKTCAYCNTVNEGTAKKCSHCGAPIEKQ